MKKLTQQQKHHLLQRQIYQEKHKQKKKYLGRDHFFGGFAPPTQYSYSKPYKQQNFHGQKQKNFDLHAPAIFNLQYENCIEVIKYINQIKTHASPSATIIVNLTYVTQIREGAIAMLLSVMRDAKKMGTTIKGTVPTDSAAKEVLEKSGFFQFVDRKIKQEAVSTINILKTGQKGTSPTFLGAEVRKAMNTVWGASGRNPLLHTVAFEMMRNSCDHAFKKSRDIWWHFSISHDEQSKVVKFSFVDNGKGIIETLKGNILKKVIRLFKDNSDILDTAFKDGIESRTGLSWRGKGLPTIYENYSDGYIKNLLVISNNVFLQFERGLKSELPIAYRGTYYYWEVDASCVKACFE